MTGWKIFTHSLNMVLRNWREALKIALVPALLGAILLATYLGGVMVRAIQTDVQGMPVIMPSMIAPLILGLLIFLVLELWVFVNWHRFVLLEEYPNGWFPPFRARHILAYVGVSLLLLIVVGMFSSVVGGMIGVLTLAGLPQFLVFLVVVAAMAMLGIFVFRLLPMLPAAAIGKRLSLKASLEAMRGTAGTAVLLSVVVVLVQMGSRLVITASEMVFAPFGFVLWMVVSLVMTLVNVSILTTLYGHYIEGRPI